MALMAYRNEQERLIAEQAVLQYRAVQAAADTAAWGHGMEVTEDAALAASREHGRQLLEQALAQRAASEKPSKPDVPAAGGGPSPSEPPVGT